MYPGRVIWHAFLLHGARTGAYDTVLDNILLIVPVVLAGAMVAVPRLLARLRARRQRDGRADRPTHHGDEPI